MNVTSMNCFDSRTATLPPFEQLCARVIRESRVPLKLRNVWALLCRLDGRKFTFTAERKERVEIAMLRLEDAGIAAKTARGWWRA